LELFCGSHFKLAVFGSRAKIENKMDTIMNNYLSKMLVTLVLSVYFTLSGNAEDNTNTLKNLGTAAQPADNLAMKWGIQVSSLFLSAGGNMVDFRYRVLDPVKAAPLAKVENKPKLIDQTTGATLLVPTTPTVGSLRQTTPRLTTGKIYFMLFADTQKHVKRGDKVSVVVGDFRVDNLTVE